MNAAEFEERLSALSRAHEKATANVNCLASERCVRCSDSTFLKDCKNVARSNYCTSCVDCTECSHTTHSTGCVGCSHCERCERCVGCAYLVRCVDCAGCTYCFGCVGLSKKDFHILNEPYDRQAYFTRVAELRRALRHLTMRAVVQRVTWAKVEVDGVTVGEIGPGLLVYLGAGKGDGDADRAYVLSKVLGLRIFENDEGKMDRSVVDVGGAFLVVSQFTLYGDVRKGRRPSFDAAMPPEEAERAYEAFLSDARSQGIKVEAGRFRAMMKVSSLNDGPVTIWIDSAKTA